LRLVTEDHSLVEEQVRAGIITPEQAANAPGRNILSRALGREKNVETDLFEEPWASHTTLLLCSDGLWGTLPEPVMAEVISTMRPQEAVEELINVAMDEGSTDNISAVIVRESRET
jgi:protein phosphatase